MPSSDIFLDKKIFKNFFGIEPSQISDKVIVSPFIPISLLKKISPLSKEFKGYLFSGIISKEFTYIKTGIGANMLGDCILSLKNSSVKTIVFIGSCGGFGGVKIGDIILPERAYNGEGFSRYFNRDAECAKIIPTEASGSCRKETPGFSTEGACLPARQGSASGKNPERFIKTEPVFNFTPENFIALNDVSYKNAFTSLKQSEAEFKTGDIYTIGSLFAERNDFLKSLNAKGFLGIDLELSAFFSALKTLGIKGASLLYVEDIPLSMPFWAPSQKKPLGPVINRTIRLSLHILNAL